MKITSIDAITVSRVLRSNKLTYQQKAEFLKKNSSAIKQIIRTEISQSELETIMKKRPLIRFRPLKNSFTKQGDKILLAKSLGIEKKEVNSYINNIVNNGFKTDENVTPDNIAKVSNYVFRHGTKQQVIKFLDYELSDAKFTLERLYKLVDENDGGLFEYFSRPIHRMDNRTLSKLYNVISKNLNNSAKAGYIDKDKLDSISEFALVKIYQIQNHSKLIRAAEIYKQGI
ncbi:MAG: hypothetical protein NC200_02720 [Candidatus Gastranaerophilales bacterium]|nr:hypothetical protein [Candidatus Gastranaerophilales bacterium]